MPTWVYALLLPFVKLCPHGFTPQAAHPRTSSSLLEGDSAARLACCFVRSLCLVFRSLRLVFPVFVPLVFCVVLFAFILHTPFCNVHHDTDILYLTRTSSTRSASGMPCTAPWASAIFLFFVAAHAIPPLPPHPCSVCVVRVWVLCLLCSLL